MKVAIWDTYATRANGSTMHFDIVVPESLKNEALIYQFGKTYLITKNEKEARLTSEECQFCHIETATSEMERSILERGFYIIEMQGCE